MISDALQRIAELWSDKANDYDEKWSNLHRILKVEYLVILENAYQGEYTFEEDLEEDHWIPENFK